MEILTQFIDVFLHLDVYLNSLASWMGIWLYLVIFAVVFCETGLVVTPFLPGDSLLFACGALATKEGSPINIGLLFLVVVVAAVLGDLCNYEIGKWLGPKVFNRKSSFLLNTKHLEQAHQFYEKHGGKTIILARFIPIIRTFAPFVAGIGKMAYSRFASYNVVGGIVWAFLFTCGGYWFADLPIVKTRFHYVILVIIVLSAIPAVYEIIKAKLKK